MVNAENGQERAARLSYADEMEGVLETEMQQKGKDSPIPESQVSWLDSRPIEGDHIMRFQQNYYRITNSKLLINHKIW